MYTRKQIFIAGVILILISISATFSILFVQGLKDERLRAYIETSRTQDRLSDVVAIISNFPGEIGKDMLSLQSMASVDAFLHDKSAENVSRTDQDLQQFMYRNDAYIDVMLFTESCLYQAFQTGGINSRLLCDTNNSSLIKEVLDHTRTLPPHGVYVSPLESYVQNINGKDVVTPSILYGANMPGKTGGVIVAVVDANYFLEEVRRLERSEESVVLVNTDGAYVANQDVSKEKVMGGSANFYEDYPFVTRDTLMNPTVSSLASKKGQFVFLRIDSLTSNFEMYTQEGNSSLENANKDSEWIVVSISSKTGQEYWWLRQAYLVMFVITLVTHFLVLALLYTALFCPTILRGLLRQTKEFDLIP